MLSFSAETYTLEQCKEEFITTLAKTKREGIDKLIEYLDKKSEFFTAPASTRFHESREGGLLRHSLNVYTRLLNLFSQEQMLSDAEKTMSEADAQKMLESIAIVALLHDLCKHDMYVVSTRNKKQEDGTWVQVPYYTVNDHRMPYGHGEKSVYIASAFIKLTREEAIAIRFHMGNFEGQEGQDTSLAYNEYKLALMLHIADLQATHIDELGTSNEK